MVSVADLKPDLSKFGGKRRVKPELALPSFETGVAAQEQIDGTRHCTEMDAFPRCPALHVGQIAVQRLASTTSVFGQPGPAARNRRDG